VNLKKCSLQELRDFIAKNSNRLTPSTVNICFPPMVVWYDKQAPVGAIESIVATKTMNEMAGISDPNEYQIPENGDLEVKP